MSARPDSVRAIRTAVREALCAQKRVLLAVSGGRDSMVMLDAAAEVARDRIAAVATFDHATGPAATEAATLVEQRCGALGIRAIRGRAESALHGEAMWREARWSFLRATAAT